MAIIGGFGSVPIKDQYGNNLGHASVWEFGTQLMWYPLAEFKKLGVGAEAIYLRAKVENIGGFNIAGVASGLAVGPLIGYKVLTESGFTFVVQGGVSYMAVRGETKDTQGLSSSQQQSAVLFNLNLNLGWTF